MLNVAGMLEPWSRVLDEAHRRTLLRIAALVAAAMFLAPSAGNAAIISCVTSEDVESFCEGTPDTYDADDEFETNTWKFFTDGSFTDLIYTLEISGDPTSTFDLEVFDRVVTQEELTTSLEGPPPLFNFPNAVCIPTFDEDECGLFDVFAGVGQTPEWEDPGYLLQIAWFPNDNLLSDPPDDGNNTILKAPDFFLFTQALREIEYSTVGPLPGDGTISGRGDGFSTHGAFRLIEPVPEPASLILVGTGLTGLLYRSRRKRRRG